MFRMCGRTIQKNRILKETVYEDPSDDTRTHKVFRGLEKICYDLDLPVPIWLEANISRFKRHASTRFSQDNFIEDIPFDCLEIEIIEED